MGNDFDVTFGGSVHLLHPRTKAAQLWCDEHLPDDALMLGDAYAIEARFLTAILNGLSEDGYRVGLDS